MHSEKRRVKGLPYRNAFSAFCVSLGLLIFLVAWTSSLSVGKVSVSEKVRHSKGSDTNTGQDNCTHLCSISEYRERKIMCARGTKIS